MRQRSLSVLVAAATGLAMSGLAAAPAQAVTVGRHAEVPTEARLTVADTTESSAVRTGAARFVLASWERHPLPTLAVVAPVQTAPAAPVPSLLWTSGVATVADDRTLRRAGGATGAEPSRRPASQYT
ncbi:hypothetical protein BJY16_006937 [Actinoplanes octamycinicus]|uniref:Uncharacterized protein n=1 Tax=Actinoplanes octamycinicus TaxID=135948 RepID=A0A7W7MAW7_9ACTN|nr:hypothetical protein [Actinoplanes octamycinicus]MBB4743478.1 hypothetical protein [Actinoplanes octamycinicus]GIE62537.1 hypothetical protein Aoc01nite_79390 [Actinoplanes octamycinicus]